MRHTEPKDVKHYHPCTQFFLENSDTSQYSVSIPANLFMTSFSFRFIPSQNTTPSSLPYLSPLL